MPNWRANRPGERLHLVAAGEQRELLRVGRANLREPLGQDLERALPGDRLELAGATLAAGLAQQRLGQPRRRDLLHDAGAPLAQITPLFSGWSGLPSM